MTIISLTEKKARKIEFDPKLTVINSQREDGTSLNRTGKSLIMKSIYFAFGTALNKYTTNWKDLNICTILKFKLNNQIFKIFRHGTSFVLLNEDTEEFKQYYSIGDLKEFFVELFGFNIRLPLNTSKDETKTTFLYPGSIFMPFYLDQDIGWLGEWRSFSDVSLYKNWKQEILLFHTGVKSKYYYELLEEQTNLSEENKNNKLRFKTFESIYQEQIKRNKDVLDLNVDITDFKSEIDQLTAVLNRQQLKKNSARDELLSLFNEKFEIEENYNNAVQVLKELNKDIEYITTNIQEEYIKCPTCGSIHENSVSNRFVMYDETEKCEMIMMNYMERKDQLDKQISTKETKILELDNEIETINSILSKKRNEITFAEVVKSEGAKEILKSLNADMRTLNNEIENIDGRLKSIISEKTQISKKGKEKQKEYSSLFNEYLTMLDVVDINHTDHKKIGEKLQSNGSDLSRAVLAECFAHYEVIRKYSASVVCPIVVDTPLQQDQGSEKTDLIFNFLVNKQPKNSQIIIATTEVHNSDIDGKEIRLLDKMDLLKAEDFQNCQKEFNYFMNLLIL